MGGKKKLVRKIVCKKNLIKIESNKLGLTNLVGKFGWKISGKNIVEKFCGKILLKNLVLKMGEKIVLKNCVEKWCEKFGENVV